MVHVVLRLWKIHLIIRYRLCHHLCLVALHRERCVCFVGCPALLRRFETVLEAINLTRFSFAVTHHLRSADRIHIDKLLATASITVLWTHNRLVIAHR